MGYFSCIASAIDHGARFLLLSCFCSSVSLKMPAALVSVRPGHLYLLPPRKKTCTESCLFVAFPAGFCYNDTKSHFHKHSTPLMKTDPKILLRKAGVRMPNILILGGGAAGLAAALAAAQSAPAAQVIVLERNPKPGKKLLATGNGRCNLDNTGIAPELYFTADPAALRPLLDAVNTADPLRWFRALGLYTRTDEAGRVYPYSNQAADVLALLEHHLAQHHVQLRTGCTVRTLNQSRSGYAVQFETAEGSTETLRADAVICAMGGEAGPQFGTDGFGTRFAAQCGGRVEPLYPCLTALQCAKPRKALAGIRAKAAASLLDGARVLACENGEVQFTDYGLSGICIMQLSGLLAPGPSTFLSR